MHPQPPAGLGGQSVNAFARWQGVSGEICVVTLSQLGVSTPACFEIGP